MTKGRKHETEATIQYDTIQRQELEMTTSSKKISEIAYTLTGMISCCPDSFIKTTPLPPGYPWVSGAQEGPPQPVCPQQRIRSLVLNHQNIKDLEPQNLVKIDIFV